MDALAQFAYCPRCGAPTTDAPPSGPFRCGTCGFTLFFNTASAVSGLILRQDGRALFIQRAKDPAKGQLGMAGGFVDVGESAEAALRREVREEVGLEVVRMVYLASNGNDYLFAGITYRTLDICYVTTVRDSEAAAPLDSVDSIVWIDPMTVDLDVIAFESMRQALRLFRQLHG
jgi:NAD+ diphosphatase